MGGGWEECRNERRDKRKRKMKRKRKRERERKRKRLEKTRECAIYSPGIIYSEVNSIFRQTENSENTNFKTY